MGLTGYYRKFIKDYGKIAAPLNKLTSINVDFKWEEKHMIALEKLKELLINPPVLIYPDFKEEFILTTDASGTGIGAELIQMRNGRDMPIAFASRALNNRERTIMVDSAIEKELLAVVWATKHFRQFLYGRKFTIFTDHKPLVYLNSMSTENLRLLKYKAELSEFDFVIKYKKGAINTNADALSRMFIVLVTDEVAKELLIKENHETPVAGHRGVDTTVKRINELGFSWPKINKEVKDHIKKCEKCQTNKLYKKTKMPMVETDTPSKPWQKVALDIVGPLPKSARGNEYVLTVQCAFSKFVIAIPLIAQDVESVAQALNDQVFTILGYPDEILTDQGTNFQSKLFKSLCKLCGIKKIRTSAFRPQSNGAIERMHRSLKEYLRHFTNEQQDKWDEFLRLACFAHNSSVHSSTKFSPFELFTGRKPNIPSSFEKTSTNEKFYAYDDFVDRYKHNMRETFKIAKDNLELMKKGNKRIFDKSINPKEFKVGELVQLLNETVRQGRSKNFFERSWDLNG